MSRAVAASVHRLIGRLKCLATSRIRRQNNVVKAERHRSHLVNTISIGRKHHLYLVLIMPLTTSSAMAETVRLQRAVPTSEKFIVQLLYVRQVLHRTSAYVLSLIHI